MRNRLTVIGEQTRLRYLTATVFAPVALIVGTLSAVADDHGRQDSSFANMHSRLARFDLGDRSLADLIVFPDYEKDVAVVIFCRAWIQSDGIIGSNICLPSNDVDEAFKHAVETAVRSIDAAPALVKGEAHSTRMFYRVVFFQVNGVAEIGVFYNWGTDADTLGHNYEAPQRYTHFVYPPGCTRFAYAMAIKTTMRIGVDGSLASEVSIDTTRMVPTRACFRAIRDLYTKSRFIPGRLDGEPVEASLVELFGDIENMRVGGEWRSVRKSLD